MCVYNIVNCLNSMMDSHEKIIALMIYTKQLSRHLSVIHIIHCNMQGTELKNRKTTFQTIHTIGRELSFLSLSLLVEIKLFIKKSENNNILGDIMVALFSCYLNSFPVEY